MNGIAIALLIGSAEGFFAAFTVFSQVRRRRANVWLGLFVATCALLCAAGALDQSDLPLSHPDSILWVDGLLLAVGPLLYAYLHAFTGRPLDRRWGWLHGLPALLASLYFWRWHLLPRDVKIQLLVMNRFLPPVVDPVLLLVATQLLIYLLACLRFLSQIGEELKEVSSNLDRISFQWLRRFLLIIIGLYAVWLPTVIQGMPRAELAFALAFPLAIYLLAAVALWTPEVLGPEAAAAAVAEPPEPSEPEAAPLEAGEDPVQDEKYRKSRLPENLLHHYQQRLQAAMEARKLFLDPDLNLAGLAGQIGLTSHHLSQVLNEKLGVRFCDYVNSLRVEEAQRLLADPEYAQTAILDLALQAGFNTKSTFNAVFKRATGCTPNVWRARTMRVKAS